MKRQRMVSPFEVLEIDEDADEAEIERAYRRRVKEAHPDRGGTLEAFQLVRRAYGELTERERNGGGTDPADIDLEEDDDPAEAKPVRVEFLDYEVLTDYGWSLDDDDLFRKASHAVLDDAEYGRLIANPGESLLEAAENRGFGWPFSCRGGACANCAVYLVEGELSQPANHIMPEDLTERGYRLSCNGYAISDELKVVFNVKNRAELDELILPPGPFTRR